MGVEGAQEVEDALVCIRVAGADATGEVFDLLLLDGDHRPAAVEQVAIDVLIPLAEDRFVSTEAEPPQHGVVRLRHVAADRGRRHTLWVEEPRKLHTGRVADASGEGWNLSWYPQKFARPIPAEPCQVDARRTPRPRGGREEATRGLGR
jgi:hypothetical protein